ncbi:MAG: hypothetical protein JGK17_31275 [Microcoleus sp. PH2017_10_PVI_O_A]|uniref:hypothetical protein n=1 Tax=unclassified Microcoleus TaxID=2642155 RepID=UPI001D37153A|nr:MULTISPECIES: hypothetical protein [unclassified Microcoleus]TAE73582.1 MAG: hypothetical protein EAZ83_31350 [Oscillatoriales cyanobacterium]MCC3409940.1 hypothetical protein [Microcoleus sp. PH2017_10_PVI_O_A]MCC3464188.1 hypothetical protein [Microcoleus sp. PH2017_11_PCY_U_A]MCC3482531.1 hypothetical protein [Microcoleus sp. PH2017_12_PCY_D_A]MCC3532357.1 hypothetical protein [Microcoleus sp. PH2017_21_RUC_O_A]
MSEPIIVISSSNITKDELIAFIQTVGLEIVEQPNDPFFGYLGRVDMYIWLTIDNRSVAVLEDGEPNEFAIIKQKLGGEPQTGILLEMSRTPGNKLLAYELAASLAKQWPCVVDNLSGYDRRITSSTELFALLESGCDFEEY